MKYYKCTFYRNSWVDTVQVHILLAPSQRRAKKVIKEAFPNLATLTIELLETKP